VSPYTATPLESNPSDLGKKVVSAAPKSRKLSGYQGPKIGEKRIDE